MGARLLLLYVICQMAITESLGGVTLPFTDFIGKVTPIKPKPSPASAVSSSVTKSKSLTCDGKDLNQKLFSSIPLSREFSAPLALISSSRALPVPKIDSSSIEDVKLPDRLRQKFVSSKLFNTPITKTKPDTPDVSLSYKYPFLSSSTKLPNALPPYSSCDMYSSSLNKISSLSNIKSLPIVPVKPLKSSDTDILCSASKSNNVFALPSITPLPISRTLDSPLTLEARKPSCLEQFNSNIFTALTPCPSPYPFYYKSMFLPRVRTPSEILPLNLRPISSNAAGNIDFLSQSGSHNLLNSKTSDTSLNSFSGSNCPFLSKCYSNPMKTAEIPNSINTIQLPKSPSNVPVSIRPVISAKTAAAKNLWPPLKANSGSASVAFESTIKQPEFLPSPVLKDCSDPEMLRYSMPCLLTDKIPDFKLQPCAPLKIKHSAFRPPSNLLNSPATSLVPVSPSSPIVDVLSNKQSSVGSSKKINTPHMFPIIGASVETIEKINTHGPSCNCQSCVDSKEVPTLQRINLASPCAPKLASYQHPLFNKERVINPIKYSPPIIPLEPISTISFGSSAYSPITYLPSKISQTPSISYVNQSPSSITQCTTKMVSSINDLVSNIAKNILSSYMSYLDSTPQNIPPKPEIQLSSYNNPDFILKQTSRAFPSPQRNPVNTQSILPVKIPQTDCINLPVVGTSTIICSDAPCKSSAFDVSCGQPILVCPTQPTGTVLPSTSLITYSPPLCPSQLPSPSLPSYPTIASPLYMEAPVFKVSSSKKDSDIEKLMELMLLAEILNNDESFDWDDLDTLLAFLSVN